MKRKLFANNKLLLAVFAVAIACVWAASPLWLSSRAQTNSASAIADNNANVEIQAPLTGDAVNNVRPFGRSEYKVFSNSSARQLEVEVFNVNLPRNTALDILLNDQKIGSIVITDYRSGETQLRSDRNQTVPTIVTGDTIKIAQGSTTILTGVFGGFASPSPTASVSPSPRVSPSPFPSIAPPLFAPLTGATINNAPPNGLAQYFVAPNGSRRFSVYARFVNLPNGTSLDVFVGTVNVGQITLRNGEGELELNADSNSNLPSIVVGTTISVKNGNATVLSGTFAAVFPTPTPRVSPSPNVSPSPSVSPSPKVSPSPNVSPSPSGSPTPTPTPRVSNFFRARLNGRQVVPAVTTAARGEVKILLNQDQTQIQVLTAYFNLSSDQTGATINAPALPGANAAQIFDLGVTGGTSGFLANKTFAVTAEQVAQLRAGLWYVTIKSTANPNGEIRGQVRAFAKRGDFDGDGRSDLSVFRPSNNAWYFTNSSDSQFRAFSLGNGGDNDKAVAGDYDGDGVSDAAVFNSNANGYGYWQIRRSSDGGIGGEQFGLATDVPVAGDFDGDGRSDIAVFRPSNGTWYIRRSSDNGFTAVQWGLPDDKPVVADFDGDGRADIAVFRPSTGVWYINRSSDNGFTAVQWGISEDIPQSGDFDGDGQADITVFRPSTGVWYTLRSIDGRLKAAQFGTNGDVPTAGDFDSDELTDIAVFRPSNGTWYVLRSSDNSFVGAQFGTNGDKPTVK